MPDKIDEELHKFLDGPPVTKGNDIGFPAGHPLAGADVVSQYTDDDAVKDGTLVDITQACAAAGGKLKRVLITRPLYRAALTDLAEYLMGVADISKPLKKLLATFSRAVDAAGPGENEMWWFDLGLEEMVKACHDGQGRITFCFPSED